MPVEYNEQNLQKSELYSLPMQ